MILTVGVGILVVYFFTQKKDSGKEQDVDGLVDKILLGLNGREADSLTRIIEQINKNGVSQTQNLTENLQKLEQRFGELQNKLSLDQSRALEETKQKFDKQASEQKFEFQKIRQENLQALQNIQNAVSEKLSKSISDLNEMNKKNFDLLSQTNQEKLKTIQEEIEKRMDENLKQNLKSFEDVTKNLGQMQSTAQKMIDSTKSVEKLNNIFERTSSKAFGNFGEEYLESLLKEHLSPKVWSSQVTVPGTNDKIDFVIEMGGKKIGIDSKFPVTRYRDYLDSDVENKSQKLKEYLRSVLDMATEISKKYLQNDNNGYLDALMIYLPSDSMYSEVVNNEKMMENLHKLKVTPISPVNILSMITLIQSYEFRTQVSKNAENIIAGLSTVKKNVESFREEFRKLGDKLRQAQQNYDTADRNLLTVQSTVARLEHTPKEELSGEEKNKGEAIF